MEQRLKQLLRKPIIVASHSDADGVSSAVLVSYVFSIRKIVFPEIFGDVDDSIDLLLDGVPRDPMFSNFVIDHHVHPREEDRNYILYWKNKPTSLIVWELLKDKIPKKQWWKTVIGCCGDGQPELIPTEIWNSDPQLFYEITSIASGRYGKYVSSKPVWQSLSPLINYCCRLKKVGSNFAFNMLRSIQRPLEMIYEESFIAARDTIIDEVNTTISNLKAIDLGVFVYGEISSENKIEGLIAMRFVKPNKTVILVNSKTGTVVLRGVFSNYLIEKLKLRGWECGGHPGWAGLNLGDKKSKELLNDIISISNELGR